MRNVDDDLVEKAIAGDVPHIYLNGFINVLSNADVLTILQTNGQTVGTLNMSFTVAKTLSAALGQLIGDLEESTGREIMTVAETGSQKKSDEETK